MTHGLIAPRSCLVAYIAAAVVIHQVGWLQVGPISVVGHLNVAHAARERHRVAFRGIR